MIWLTYCFVSIASVSILTAAPNIYMVIQIYKNENQSFGAGRMFTLIGVSNIACAFIMFIRVVLTANTPFPILSFFATCTIVSFLHQLGFNVSLAYERLQVVKNGLAYHTSDAKKKLERKLSICVVISSTIIGVSSSTLRYTMGNMTFQLIPIATTRILGYITLCVIYIKLYFAIKAQNRTVAPTTVEQGLPSIRNNDVIARRQKRLKHKKMFFIGITSSFFISNLTTMIIFLAIDKTTPCHTIEGILSTTSASLSLLGMAFDPVWYFYMKRRSERS